MWDWRPLWSPPSLTLTVLKLCQGVQQSMAAAACCRHLDIRVCIPGAHIPLLLGPVRPGPHRGVLHHHPGPTRPLCQGIPLRVCISVSVSRYHRLLRQVSNNNQPLIDAARTASIISLSLSLSLSTSGYSLSLIRPHRSQARRKKWKSPWRKGNYWR